MLNQISQIAVQSQTNTANVVVLDNIMEGDIQEIIDALRTHNQAEALKEMA